jgi:ribosomal protein L16 Arg81 hydroxylase
MNKKERAFLETLLIKISRDPQTAFYSKDILDHKLIKWDDIEYLLNDTYRITPECIELINENRVKIEIPLFTCAWSHTPRPDPQFVFNKINAGHSLVILGASKITKEVNHICSLIESIIPQTAVDVHAYCGLKKSKSFRAHYDHADNVILHQSGKCHWKVYKQRAKDCNFEYNVNGKDLDVEFECDLESGDMIYVPKHQYHECFPLKKRISLSFPIVNADTKLDRNWYSINNK